MGRRDAISEALQRLRVGEEGALDRLVPLVYDDLRVLARRQLTRRRGQSLSTTGLVHETYLKLAAQRRATW
jgi:RNA polymerase sigma-70 factor (ECF subfamily)